MTSDSKDTTTTPDNDNEILAHAASHGLFGLVLKAWMQEGQLAALANLQALALGRIHVECKTVFSRQGVAIEIEHCSHGGRQHLATVNIKNPPALGSVH